MANKDKEDTMKKILIADDNEDITDILSNYINTNKNTN